MQCANRYGQLWARAWFPETVLRKVCVCMYVYLFVFLHPCEQTFYLKLESSLYVGSPASHHSRTEHFSVGLNDCCTVVTTVPEQYH